MKVALTRYWGLQEKKRLGREATYVVMVEPQGTLPVATYWSMVPMSLSRTRMVESKVVIAKVSLTFWPP